MKKIKLVFGAVLLATCLGSNVFAGDAGSGGGIFSFFGEALSSVVSFLRGNEDCPPRQCQNCKPKDDGSNDCRPNEN